MRLLTLLLALLLPVLCATSLRAEDEPKPPVAPDKPAADKPAADKPAADKPAADETTPGTDAPETEGEQEAEALATPRAAYAEIQQRMRKASRATRRSMAKQAAAAYLEKLTAAGSKATGEDALFLGRLQGMAEAYQSAAQTFCGVLEAEGCTEQECVMATSQLAALLGSTKPRTALGETEECDGLCQIVTDQLTKTVAAEVMPTVAQSHMMLANYLNSIKDVRGAVAHRMKAAQKNPALAYSAARSIVGSLKGSTHRMAGYEPVQIGGSGLIAGLAELAKKNVANIEARVKKAEEGEASEAVRKSLARQLNSAKSHPGRIAKLQAGLDLLGQVAPEWTVDHAFGDVQDLAGLKGKVVILDFWATWCPWCIKSFPAIRDLLRDYKDQDLVVIGVTASSGSVYEARYSLDDDLKDKLGDAGRAKPVARRVRDSQTPDPEKNLLDPESYRVVERDTIAKFIGNHEMTWPVIMIDAKEPGPKYALSGWPHAVVIDRQGRVRYLKAGALLRDRTEQVAAFRKVLDDLLAEGAQ